MMRGTEHACIPAKIDEFMCTDFLFYYILVNCTLFFVFLFSFFLRRERGLVLSKKLYREKYENCFVQDEPPLYWIQNEHSCVSYLSIRDVTRGLQSHSEKTLSLHNSNLQYEITRYQ